jgi:hypothetical protein
MFISEVLPAPDAPIIKSVYPGRAYPEQFLSTYKDFVEDLVASFSSLVVGTCT